jgi:hypothetical protein
MTIRGIWVEPPTKMISWTLDPSIEIFSTKMGIAGGGFDFENTLLDGEKGNIKSSSTKIEGQDVAFANNLLVETIGDGSGCGLVVG